jgi:hypothetical protein
MGIKAGKVVERGIEPKPQKKYVELTPTVTAKNVQQVRPKDTKIRAEDKPKVKVRAEDKVTDKKIRAEDKVKGSKPVQINRSESSQSSTREILKPSRYVEDLIS